LYKKTHIFEEKYEKKVASSLCQRRIEYLVGQLLEGIG
jgi:hypothetical protein